MARRSRDPYRLLGVPHDATRDEITLAYVQHTAKAGTGAGGSWRKDLDAAYRLLWRPRTRDRYDRLYNASVRRMRWISALGVVSVLLLLVLGLGSGFWLTSQAGHEVSLRAPIPFIKPAPSPTTARATRATPQSPSSLTLAIADLPSGYHVLSQGPASFSSGSASSAQKSATPPSWDIVFGQASGRRLVESLAVIYPDAGGARAALEKVRAAEVSQAATSLTPPTALGPDAGQWIEHAPSGGPYSVVRLVWVTGTVVSQLSVLDILDPGTIEQAVALALMQQKRLAGS